MDQDQVGSSQARAAQSGLEPDQDKIKFPRPKAAQAQIGSRPAHFEEVGRVGPTSAADGSMAGANGRPCRRRAVGDCRRGLGWQEDGQGARGMATRLMFDWAQAATQGGWDLSVRRKTDSAGRSPALKSCLNRLREPGAHDRLEPDQVGNKYLQLQGGSRSSRNKSPRCGHRKSDRSSSAATPLKA